MAIANTIVGFDQLRGLGGSGFEALQPSSARTTKPFDPTPTEAAEFGKALTELRRVQRHPDVLSAPQNQMASLLQSFIAGFCNSAGKVESISLDSKEAKFDNNDWLGWAGSFLSWWRGIKPHPWLPTSFEIQTIPDRTRIALLGDWGTGMYGAPDCARSIERNSPYSLIVHLGDVYYSGTDDEVEQRFLAPWPRVNGAVSRALNSNHEMYSGGYAYFDTTLKRFQQQSSCFVAQNTNWTIIGLDTGYLEHDLSEMQLDWLSKILEKTGTRRAILLSHHQPFSQLDDQGPKLCEKLDRWLRGGRIHAWYWGHEHRCVLYDQHPHWGLYGRCIGHSGYPYFRDDLHSATLTEALVKESAAWYRLAPTADSPGCFILDGENSYLGDHRANYGPNGYLTLELTETDAIETVQAPNGNVLRRVQLPGVGEKAEGPPDGHN